MTAATRAVGAPRAPPSPFALRGKSARSDRAPLCAVGYELPVGLLRVSWESA